MVPKKSCIGYLVFQKKIIWNIFLLYLSSEIAARNSFYNFFYLNVANLYKVGGVVVWIYEGVDLVRGKD